MLCDHKISLLDSWKKLNLLKIWGVKVNDCWYDNTTAPNYQYNYWSLDQCKWFRKQCREHNQTVLFGIYPELKSVKNNECLNNFMRDYRGN
jgi:hypothetical protein